MKHLYPAIFSMSVLRSKVFFILLLSAVATATSNTTEGEETNGTTQYSDTITTDDSLNGTALSSDAATTANSENGTPQPSDASTTPDSQSETTQPLDATSTAESQITTRAAPVQPGNVGDNDRELTWTAIGGRAYAMPNSRDNTDRFSRYDAIQFCQDHQSTITSISTKEEWDLLKGAGFLPDDSDCSKDFWLAMTFLGDASASDTECDINCRRFQWEWYDGSIYDWSNWKTDEPGPMEDAVRATVCSGDYKWAGTWESASYWVVCEKDAVGAEIAPQVFPLNVMPGAAAQAGEIATTATPVMNAGLNWSWKVIGDRRYFVHGFATSTHDAAVAFCANAGARLLTVNTQEELDLIKSNFLEQWAAYPQTCVEFWLGLEYSDEATGLDADDCDSTCRRSYLRWVDGTSVTWANWQNMLEPDRGEMVFTMRDCPLGKYTWRGSSETDSHRYICETSRDGQEIFTTRARTTAASVDRDWQTKEITYRLSSEVEADIDANETTNGTADEPRPTPSYEDWMTFEESEYRVMLGNKSHADAEELCRQYQSKLVSISTPREFIWIKQQLPDVYNCEFEFWIGLIFKGDPSRSSQECDITCRQNSWEWMDGTPLTWTNWFVDNKSTEPNWGETLAQMTSCRGAQYKWAGSPVGWNQFSAICERQVEWLRFEDSEYRIVLGKQNYSDAVLMCRQDASYLASISTEREFKWLEQQLPTAMNCSDEYWIGLMSQGNSTQSETQCDVNCRRASWAWTDGSTMTWTNWLEDEPDMGETFARITTCPGVEFKWAGSTEGSHKHAVICEREVFGTFPPLLDDELANLEDALTDAGNPTSGSSYALIHIAVVIFVYIVNL